MMPSDLITDLERTVGQQSTKSSIKILLLAISTYPSADLMQSELGSKAPHRADTPPMVGNYVTAGVGCDGQPSNLGKYVTAGQAGILLIQAQIACAA